MLGGQSWIVEAIMWLHPDWAPPTYQQGSCPIDRIFTALQLLATAAGGYLSFGNAIPSDHCAIWLDLHLPDLSTASRRVYQKTISLFYMLSEHVWHLTRRVYQAMSMKVAMQRPKVCSSIQQHIVQYSG